MAVMLTGVVENPTVLVTRYLFRLGEDLLILSFMMPTTFWDSLGNFLMF